LAARLKGIPGSVARDASAAATSRRGAARTGLSGALARATPPEGSDARKRRTRRIAERLAAVYPDAACALVFGSPWELLVATVLSAQSPDAQVNRTTPALFREFPTPAALAAAPRGRLESIIRPLGVFRRKAESLQRMALQVHHHHCGEVPRTLPALTRLAGVGRKTANVVLGVAYGEPAITVDTHVGRLARRMGLSMQTDPVKVEQDLVALLPPKRWTAFSHGMIRHGREVCTARRPACLRCPLLRLCPRVGA
jgi:endonuclease-3